MFHVFTLQGKLFNVPVEQLSEIQKVHQANKANRVRKIIDGEPRNPGSGEASGTDYAREAYQKAIQTENYSEPVFHASEIMSSPVMSIAPGMSAADAWKSFEASGVRHMPVLSAEGTIIGIVSDRDLLKQLIITNGNKEDARETVIRDIMATRVIVTGPTTDIRRIAKAMMDHHIGTMPIVDDDGLPIGIITRSDILHAIINHPQIRLWA